MNPPSGTSPSASSRPAGTGLIVQARMGSTRLPGKVLREALGKPMLGYLLESLAHSALGAIVVVTSDQDADDGIARLAGNMGIPCVRGSESDVASRFEAAILRFGFSSFVRVCGDSPLMDQGLVRRGMDTFAEGGFDLVTNTHPRSYPKGQSVEVVDSAAFLSALPRFTDAEDKEHVTRYFYRHPERYRIGAFASGGDWGGVQLSVDTPEDFRRFESLVARAHRPHWEYAWSEWMAMGEGSEESAKEGAE